MKQKLSLILLIFCLSSARGQTSLEKLNLEPGPYMVGFQHVLKQDVRRSYQRLYDWNNQKNPRPIPISIWYPSPFNQQIEESQLRILDYLRILKEEEEWEDLPDEQILNWFYYPNTTVNQQHLKEYTWAYRDLPKAAGR
ncbi:MAG: alpha/beta hydrolase, partial [Bacteroidota bacterium]